MRLLFSLAALISLTAVPCLAVDKLVVHEWGTFTSLQDEAGYTIGGINSDDEALPSFVHDSIREEQTKANPFSKGFPVCFPSITMRLETPVLYFHPAPGTTLKDVDVSAEFHGGLLTQFYPDAVATKPQLTNARLQPLTAETTGKLAWSGLSVGGDKSGPVSDSHVWTSPRGATAANVLAKNGEAEKFLFYRGVGHLDAPIKAVRNGSSIDLHTQGALPMKALADLSIAGAWFCEFRDDGKCAWRSVGPLALNLEPGQTLASISAFNEADFSSENLVALKTAMHAALVHDGLFDDEATAMLETWSLSYFKSAGTRLFFTVPRAWTDYYLPLHVSVDADINRVMVGRIDLVTPEHRETMRQLAAIDPKTDGEGFSARYTQLGRFRDALLIDDQRRHPSAAIKQLLASRGVEMKAN